MGIFSIVEAAQLMLPANRNLDSDPSSRMDLD
jgi:hypothetical protein